MTSTSALEHVEGLFEAQRGRVVRVAHEARDAGRVTHDRPGVFVELHAHEHVAGDPDARDHLALTVLDLDDVLHRDLDLVDVLFDLERRLALLDVGLHLALEARVGVDDVPLAGQRAQFGAERLVRVLVLVRPRRRPASSASAISASAESRSPSTVAASAASTVPRRRRRHRPRHPPRPRTRRRAPARPRRR